MGHLGGVPRSASGAAPGADDLLDQAHLAVGGGAERSQVAGLDPVGREAGRARATPGGRPRRAGPPASGRSRPCAARSATSAGASPLAAGQLGGGEPEVARGGEVGGIRHVGVAGRVGRLGPAVPAVVAGRQAAVEGVEGVPDDLERPEAVALGAQDVAQPLDVVAA